MNELIDKIINAREDYYKEFSGVSDIIFIHPELLDKVLDSRPPVQSIYTVHDQKLFGCEVVMVPREGFEVLASSHDQMKYISEHHVGTTNDIELLKLKIVDFSKIGNVAPDTPQTAEFITIPYFILSAYRNSHEQKKVDKLW